MNFNLNLVPAGPARERAEQFLQHDWERRLHGMNLVDLKTALLLAMTQAPAHKCNRAALALLVLRTLGVAPEETVLERFSPKVLSVAGVLVKQGALILYPPPNNRFKLAAGFEMLLLRLLESHCRQCYPAPPPAREEGGAPVARALEEIDDPLLLRGKRIAHVAVPLETSYFFRQEVELLFSDRTICRLLMDREPSAQREAFARLYRSLRRTAGGSVPARLWEEFEYGLRLRGIDPGAAGVLPRPGEG